MTICKSLWMSKTRTGGTRQAPSAVCAQSAHDGPSEPRCVAGKTRLAGTGSRNPQMRRDSDRNDTGNDVAAGWPGAGVLSCWEARTKALARRPRARQRQGRVPCRGKPYFPLPDRELCLENGLNAHAARPQGSFWRKVENAQPAQLRPLTRERRVGLGCGARRIAACETADRPERNYARELFRTPAPSAGRRR